MADKGEAKQPRKAATSRRAPKERVIEFELDPEFERMLEATEARRRAEADSATLH